jgi:NADH:ubiquinone reductase (H+-translocating)
LKLFEWTGILSFGLIASAIVWRYARRGSRANSLTHQTESSDDFVRARTKVIVLGAGFGGLTAALALDRHLNQGNDDASVLFTPLLWTVADGRSSPTDILVPLRDFQHGRRLHVLQTDVKGIDLRRREVLTDSGAKPYDYLVIALGSVISYPPLPGLVEYARPFRRTADALGLRDQLIDAVERAHHSTDPEEQRAWLTFVIAGGGDTGVELAGAIHSYLSSGLLREYPWLAPNAPGPNFRVVIVGRAPQLVPMAGLDAALATRRELEKAGVEIMTGTAVEEVLADAVVTSRGVIPTKTVFWAAGISAPPMLRDLPVAHAKGGTLVVDEHLRLPDHPEVFAIGDCAWTFDVDGAPVPPTAQAAQLEGKYVAKSIAATIEARPLPSGFRFSPKGHLALLGARTGLARVGPYLIAGVPAWLMWHAYYLSRIPSWKRRVSLSIDWILSGIFGRETAQVRLERTAPLARDAMVQSAPDQADQSRQRAAS